jgi:hypothetical protein
VPTVTGNFTDVMTVQLHHPLTLHCDVSDPKATVTWQRTDGKPLGGGVTVQDNDIIFQSVTKPEEGVYECVANTLLGKVQTAVDIRLAGQFTWTINLDYFLCFFILHVLV